jgi:L-asparagine oxygenase
MLDGVHAQLERDGFYFCRALAPEMPTVEIALRVGAIVDFERLLPSSGISTVQVLRPRRAIDVGPNRFSGYFGLGAFPLHTDLAHWALPPHYFLLRCAAGADDVFTSVLSWSRIVESVGTAALQKAVFGGRRPRIGRSGLVRAMSRHDGAVVFRWEPIFLKPLNQEARALAKTMGNSEWNEAASKILLKEPGDTLIVDNWSMLHGRGEVKAVNEGRQIERVYLSEVFR